MAVKELTNRVYQVSVEYCFDGDKRFKNRLYQTKESAKKYMEKTLKIYTEVGHFTEITKRKFSIFAQDKDHYNYIFITINIVKIKK